MDHHHSKIHSLNYQGLLVVANFLLLNRLLELLTFRFLFLKKADESPELPMAQIRERYRDLGSIRIEVWRKHAAKIAYSPMSKHSRYVGQLVPEKAVKGEAIDMSTLYDLSQ